MLYAPLLYEIDVVRVRVDVLQSLGGLPTSDVPVWHQVEYMG